MEGRSTHWGVLSSTWGRLQLTLGWKVARNEYVPCSVYRLQANEEKMSANGMRTLQLWRQIYKIGIDTYSRLWQIKVSKLAVSQDFKTWSCFWTSINSTGHLIYRQCDILINCWCVLLFLLTLSAAYLLWKQYEQVFSAISALNHQKKELGHGEILLAWSLRCFFCLSW